MTQPFQQFWSIAADDLMRKLGTSPQGLAAAEAARLRLANGPNSIRPRQQSGIFTILLRQFNSPIILILIAAAVLSLFLSESVDAVIIMSIVFASGILGFWQERGATVAVKKLLELVTVTARVLRDGGETSVPIEDVVTGDIVIFSAGGSVPGDCLLIESENLSVDEASLTGETFPVLKAPGVLPADTALAERTNVLFMGTHVVSGTGKGLVVATGTSTELGRISSHLQAAPPITEFERGIRRFGSLLMEITLTLVIVIFAVNVYLHRPVVDSFLFSIALAVGLTPQLLPAIISINLSHGARAMARRKVIVKRLSSIENFGSMNILCSDKTGTLTEGTVQVNAALGTDAKPSERTFLYAYLNAFYETGFHNPIDDAICAHAALDIGAYRKLDETPYDFLRKRLTVLAEHDARRIMITKGALKEVLAVCTQAELSDGSVVPIAQVAAHVEECFEHQSAEGFRVLGVAWRDMAGRDRISREDEEGMTFLGIITLFDPPKQDIAATIERLRGLGVALKIITGDNHLVARSIAQRIGLADPIVMTGSELAAISNEALPRRIADVQIFAEVEPNQKERIIIGLRLNGNVVGYIGDGINDAPALHAADVGLSVNNAVDVAKDAAAIVLMEHDLNVLADGIHEGRVTFANTLKYVFMATSANFGNMFSMAGASLFLPFLPLLPKQILVTNFLTDFPEMTIATDSVDQSMLATPRRWDIRFIRNFMIVFGMVSSAFDFITFAVLLKLLHASAPEFRTGWLIESVISATVIVMVVRTRLPFYRSRPGKYLMLTTAMVVVATVALPYTPLRDPLGLAPLPPAYLAVLGGIVIAYAAAAETAKRIFYKMAERPAKPIPQRTRFPRGW